jgi:hypothetical protein
MFKIVLLMLMAGDSTPSAYEKANQVPFVSRSACDEWAAQEARRLERVIETLPDAGKPQAWELKCISAVPERGA